MDNATFKVVRIRIVINEATHGALESVGASVHAHVAFGGARFLLTQMRDDFVEYFLVCHKVCGLNDAFCTALDAITLVDALSVPIGRIIHDAAPRDQVELEVG